MASLTDRLEQKVTLFLFLFLSYNTGLLHCTAVDFILSTPEGDINIIH